MKIDFAKSLFGILTCCTCASQAAIVKDANKPNTTEAVSYETAHKPNHNQQERRLFSEPQSSIDTSTSKMKLDDATDAEKKTFLDRYKSKTPKLHKNEEYQKAYNLDRHKDGIDSLEKAYDEREDNAKKYNMSTERLQPSQIKQYEDKVTKSVYESTFSEKGRSNIESAKRNLIYGDKFQFEGKDYVQQILAHANMQQREAQNTLPTKDFLSPNEQLFIVISSSLDDQLIIRYFKSLKDHKREAQFILRGVVNNDISKIAPTIEYFQRLRNKAGEKEDFDISINPKITQLFNIERAPAFVFIKNYNGELDQHDSNMKLNPTAQAYVLYGDISLPAALEAINKKAKSEGLTKLTKALRSNSFFNKNDGNAQ